MTALVVGNHDHLVLAWGAIAAIPLFAACTIPGPIRNWLNPSIPTTNHIPVPVDEDEL